MHRIRLLVPLLALALVAATPAAHASSPGGLVVSQVYAGGGNSGASYTNDFVELFNGGSSAADLTGWSIQYASAASTSWSVTTLTGAIQPGRFYLVQLASSGAVGSTLPTPDATGTTNVANSGGKVALVQGTTALACGASAGSCSAVSSIADLVGYGSAADYEGSGAAPALSSTTAALRSGEGCTDTDANSADFTAVAPAPRNAATAAKTCSGAPPASASVSQDAAVDVDIQPVLSITLERPTISFGTVVAGDVPAAVSERVTVLSNNATGYALTVHRTAFTPADLPLAISGSAPAGAQIGPSLAGGALATIPIAPAADLTVGTSSVGSAGAGDAWQTSLAFSAPIPMLAPGHYSGTLTYTLIGR
jgi:predicted extracellular nuclease